MTENQVAEANLHYPANTAKDEFPEGYKQTELGVIPEDWEIKALGTLLSIRHGKNQKEVESENGAYPILATGGQIGWSNSFLWDKPSVLIGRKGTIDKPRYVDKPFWTVDTLFYSDIKPTADAKFLFYKFCMIDWMQYNEASGVPSLNASTIEGVMVSMPSKTEQTAIANVLSDVDALINEQEKLIAKKQAIKTATMQQLLTGRTRLPQFVLHEDGSRKGYKQSELGEIPEDWEVYRFEQNFTIYAGGDVPKDSFSKIKTDSYPYPIFANAIQGRGLYGYTGHKRSKPDSVTITARGYLGHAEYRDEPFFPIVRLLVMEPLGTVDSKFTTYAINELVEFPTESTGVPQLTAPQVGKFSISAPADLKEQTAIATILSDMDEEIQALEQRLGKTRHIKQGMMQELLTGKTRLV